MVPLEDLQGGDSRQNHPKIHPPRLLRQGINSSMVGQVAHRCGRETPPWMVCWYQENGTKPSMDGASPYSEHMKEGLLRVNTLSQRHP
jgi:hypothetical protein